jgi:hypothetical protein
MPAKNPNTKVLMCITWFNMGVLHLGWCCNLSSVSTVMLPAITITICFAGTACSFFGNGFTLPGCYRFTAFISLLLSLFAYTAGAAIHTIFATASVAAGFTIFTAGTFGKSRSGDAATVFMPGKTCSAAH